MLTVVCLIPVRVAAADDGDAAGRRPAVVKIPAEITAKHGHDGEGADRPCLARSIIIVISQASPINRVS